jgi:hypothetical protein
MYRDDHEAALARMQALETELAAHASDDRKLATLTREVADARTRLEHAEAELQRMRSTTPPRAAATSPVPTPAPEPAPGSGILTLAVVLGGLGALCAIATVAASWHETPRAAAPVKATPDPAVSGDRMLAEGIERATALALGAELVAIEATGVHADGSLDPKYGELAVELIRDRGPEPITPVDSSTPIGAPRLEHVYLRYDCIRLVYTHGRWQDQWPAIKMDIERLHSCLDTFETHPPLRRHCSIAQIWQRARRHAPATAIAKLALDVTGWSFTINDPRLSVELHERDDCGS